MCVAKEDFNLEKKSLNEMLSIRKRQLSTQIQADQGIIDCKRTETFAKEPKLAKLLWELKPTPVLNNKKSPLVFVSCL